MIPEREEQYTDVAFLRKPHGVNGEVLVELEIDAPDLLDEFELFWMELPGKKLIPMRVESCRIRGGDGQSFFVKFAGIDSREEIATYQSLSLMLPSKQVEPLLGEPEEDEALSLVGFNVVDEESDISGEIIEELENPAHDIIVLDSGMMIPMVDEYVVEINTELELVRCRNLNYLENL